MRLKALIVYAAFFVTFVLASAPASAYYSRGYTVTVINLRAGPDSDYPVISRLPSRAVVDVYGCTYGFQWCDVEWDGWRGWVSGQFLEVNYNNRRTVIIDNGPRVGVPVVVFDIGTYWDRYYYSQPFYTHRPHYAERHHLRWRDTHRDGRYDRRRDHDNRRDSGRGHYNR